MRLALTLSIAGHASVPALLVLLIADPSRAPDVPVSMPASIR
jgi:hypothetical protein